MRASIIKSDGFQNTDGEFMYCMSLFFQLVLEAVFAAFMITMLVLSTKKQKKNISQIIEPQSLEEGVERLYEHQLEQMEARRRIKYNQMCQEAIDDYLKPIIESELNGIDLNQIAKSTVKVERMS